MTSETDAFAGRLRTVVRELPVGVVVLGAAGEIELANPPALEILGVGRDELETLLSRPDFRALRRNGPTSPERLPVERPDGKTVFVEVSAVPLRDLDGAGAVVVLQDVTEREAVERAERDFITNAAHELQTPLAAIVSAIEVLQAGAKERPEDRDLFLRHIADAAGRLERLTRALLLLARVEIGDSVRTEIVAVAPVLAALAASTAGRRELRVECGDDVAVIANRTLLEQALANVVDNAVKYTSGAVSVVAEPAGERVAIAIRDSGGGIAAEDRPRVFERFYRGAGTTQSGSGLGLAIVEAAVHALGGDLELQSSEGGTSVAIVLPAARLLSR